MKDDRKTELNRAIQTIRRWLSEDIIYQRMDYHRDSLNPREHEVRVSLINDALTASKHITALLEEEKERVCEQQ